MTSVFDSVRLGELPLPNRLVMAPMTRNRASADGVPTPLMAEYYAQRASAGLIIAEASTPNAVGQTYPNITAIHNDAHVAGCVGSPRRCGRPAAGCSSSCSTAGASATPTTAAV
ncbi:oxidoreductase [Streptomyces venezuelae ATCC 10712]|uniref:Oxidoreductase n=1 Tax=Streptomyces venezuelae (strain ATCC 10712 / CBS 650.69 / DSM 40230 / JCM 4526 / NBRC 13096 / PD 04745) TaxID=953739 RepID=F2RES8_STRVP|nr:oxidoreductase [Streptomyces venezuelae ATCC 10712]